MIKSQPLKGRYTIHYLGDPAIDKDSPEHSAIGYATSFDMKHLPLVEGGKLTSFVCEPLTRKQMQRVDSLRTQDETAGLVEALAYALRAVEHWDASGAALDVKFSKDDQIGGQRVSSETLDKLYDTPAGLELLKVLGQLILNRSHLGPL